MTSGPNPALAAWSMVRARRVPPPRPDAQSTIVVDHSALATVLDAFVSSGVASLSDSTITLESYRDSLEVLDPDDMAPAEALAFWMNLYNAGALRAAGFAFKEDMGSVLRVPGAFSERWARVGGTELSLDDIEHGKIRRFGDPRIHGALVCGSASCPTLRAEPFAGMTLDHQLDDQLRFFIRHGGGSVNRANDAVWLSSVFKWYGRDFISPHSMPNLAPPDTERLRDTIAYWFDAHDAKYIWEHQPNVVFMPYDWGLGCSVV